MNVHQLIDYPSDFSVTRFPGYKWRTEWPKDAKVDERVFNTSTRGLMLLTAGCMLWVAKRLEKCADAKRCYQAAEALICFQHAPQYCAELEYARFPSSVPKSCQYLGTSQTWDDPTVEIALEGTTHRLWTAYAKIPGSHPIRFKNDMPGRLVRSTKAVLGRSGSAPFRQWLDTMYERFETFAFVEDKPRGHLVKRKFPNEEEWNEHKVRLLGGVLPPDILQTDREPNPALFSHQLDAFLQNVDWASNPFLSSPDVMREHGFDTPYRCHG